MDYYKQGKLDTARTLMENDIMVSGENVAASTEIKGIKVGLLSYATFQTGFNYRSALERDIEYMKKSNDIVIVNMHWGREAEYIADYDQQQTAHHIIDLGADLVIGHHPHVIQGIEYYKDKYIVYSLGNCSFGGNSNPFNDDIILFQQRFKMTKEGIVSTGAKVIPCRVSSKKYTNDFTPTPYEDGHIKRVLDRVVEFSGHLDYGLVDIPDDWIVDPYTRAEYRKDNSN
jgi:poly-gamma-glutamate synthesis protein (capsule biosynthesis protein)